MNHHLKNKIHFFTIITHFNVKKRLDISFYFYYNNNRKRTGKIFLCTGGRSCVFRKYD